MKAEEYIKEHKVCVSWSYNGYADVVREEVALKAIEMARGKMKEKAIEAFTDAFKQVLGACYQSDIDMFKDLLEGKP